MKGVARVLRQINNGFPYLEKEIGRAASRLTGGVHTTPSTYYLIFGGRCNIACPFCTIHDKVEPSISGPDMLRLIDEAKQLSGRGFNMSLCGGEPTIYKPLYDCLEYAHRTGVNFGFTTNGLALNPKICEKLLQFDPFNINVSLESIDPAINDLLRPFKGGTSRVLQGISNLLQEKRRSGSRVSIIIKPTIMEQNYRSLPDLVSYFGKDSGVQINFQPYSGSGDSPFWVRDIAELAGVFSQLARLRESGYPIIGPASIFEGFLEYFANPSAEDTTRFLDLHGSKRNCDIGMRAMGIHQDGDVYFCDFLGEPLGNIYKESLSSMYYGMITRRQRERMVYCNIACQRTCQRPTPLLDKARAFMRMG